MSEQDIRPHPFGSSTDLGDHKAILGYSWFATVQPNIDWKRGWIDHTQLPIVLCAPNAKKAVFTPRTRNVPRETVANQYFIGHVTFHHPTTSSTPNPRVPGEYQRHGKAFSEEESQRLPQHTIWDHAIELLPEAPLSRTHIFYLIFLYFIRIYLMKYSCLSPYH